MVSQDSMGGIRVTVTCGNRARLSIYDPTMKHSHCETVYAKELFQWLFFELVDSLRILSLLPTFNLAGLTKEYQ